MSEPGMTERKLVHLFARRPALLIVVCLLLAAVGAWATKEALG